MLMPENDFYAAAYEINNPLNVLIMPDDEYQ